MKKILIGLLLIAGCASPGGLFGETVGEKFRKALANVDAVCRERKIGPYLDPNDPEYRRKSSLMNCEVLKIKPFDLNAVLATPEGKFAYSIQLPPPLDKPRVRRADYRSAEEYFEALCEREQGDYVLERRENVAGIAQLRLPMPKYVPDSLGSYSAESAGTSYLAVHQNPPGHLVPKTARLYMFMEIVTSFSDQGDLRTFSRYSRDEQSPTALRTEMATEFSARYGYLWRGTPQFDWREEGIIGGELLVIEISTKRVLGMRRIFFRDDVNLAVTDRVDRSGGKRCPGIKNEGLHFIVDVLKPQN